MLAPIILVQTGLHALSLAPGQHTVVNVDKDTLVANANYVKH